MIRSWVKNLGHNKELPDDLSHGDVHHMFTNLLRNTLLTIVSALTIPTFLVKWAHS